MPSTSSLKYQNTFALFERSKDVLTRSLVQLFTRDERGDLSAFGTSLAVRHEGQVFLVAADHCFDPARSGKPLFVFGSSDQELTGTISRAMRVADRCPIDVGAIKLDESAIPNCTPVETSSFLMEMPIEAGSLILTCGFPAGKTHASRGRRTVEAGIFATFGPAVEPAAYSKNGLDPVHDIALYFHTSKVLTSGGHFRTAPHPKGMSGSPMWVIESIDGDVVSIGVVGLLSRYRPASGILIGTTIAAAYALIVELSASI